MKGNAETVLIQLTAITTTEIRFK